MKSELPIIIESNFVKESISIIKTLLHYKEGRKHYDRHAYAHNLFRWK